MKPDIIVDHSDTKNWWRAKEGYVGVICECMATLYVKNIPEKAKLPIEIECPICGLVIRTIYKS